MTPENGERVGELIEEIFRVSGHRVHAAVLPAAWSDDQGIRLAKSINKVLEAGEAGLRCIEHALNG